MLNKIIEFSIHNKLVVGLMMLVLLVLGSWELSRLPIDAVPDITNNQVQVITVAPSYGAADIERLVTFPIEQVNSNIPGLIEIRSFSRFGLSLVTIVFNDNTDIYWARQQVSERLQNARTLIPDGVGNPQLGPVSTGLGEIYQYVLRPSPGFESTYNITQLRTIQDWIVRRQLLSVKGVADVSSFGGKLKQYEVQIDPGKLNANNLTIADVFAAIKNNNENTGGSYIEKGAGILNISTEGLFAGPEEIEQVVIRNLANGTPLMVRDIAEIKEGHATRFGALCLDDKGEVAGAVVMMLKGANSSEVVSKVKSKIEEIQKTLPKGLVIEPFLDRTKMVNNAIGTVEKNLAEGALIVVFVLVLFLGNFRAGLLVASVIPLAMLFAVIMMNLFGVSGNLMSLGALDFGLIIDGAVIIVEAVMHQLSHSKLINKENKLEQHQMNSAVANSAGRMMNSAVFGQLIILVVYLPIFTLQGIEGKMFKPMAQTVAFALAGAFLLSLTYVPMMSALVLSKKIKHAKTWSDRWMDKLAEKFQLGLSVILNIPKIALSVVILLFSSAVVILLSLGGEFIPTLEEGDFAVETRLLTGSSLNTTIAETQKAARILKSKFPEVVHVVTKIGSGEIPTDPMPMEAADMIIVLKDKKDWVSAKSFNELAEKMSVSLEDVPGLTFSFQYPVQMRFNELMTGAKQDVVCKIFGEDLDSLAKYAEKMSGIISSIEGAKDIYVESVTGMPQVLIQYDRNALAQFGLAVSDVNRVVNTAFAGAVAGTLYEGEKRFAVTLRLQGQLRNSIDDVERLLIPVGNGVQIPLSHLAKVEVKDGPNQIQREEAKRRIIIGFNTRGRDVQSIVDELQAKVTQQIQFPAGYYPVYGGSFENLLAAKKRLSVAVPVSLFLIFLLLYFTFHSVRQGLLIYSAIPLSAIGGVYALAIRGMPFSISAGIGFIALFGVAVLNGIVLVAEFNRLKESGTTSLREIVLKGTSLRLRPVLMTACVASLGFLPMALSQGAGAEVQRPLATVVIGGLLIATLLTLFILPVLYVLFESKKKNLKINSLVLFVFAIFISATGIKAQSVVTLKAACDSAIKNNLQIKNTRLTSEYKQKLLGTANSIQPLNVGVEYGQINSSYKDNRFSISQGFSFPTIYARQKSLLRSELNQSRINEQLNEAEIKRDVATLYYDIVQLSQKRNILRKNDSLFSVMKDLAASRFKAGESNLLEKTSTDAQQGQVLAQLIQLDNDLEILILKFNLLLNSKALLIPSNQEPKIAEANSIDTSLMRQHPLLQILDQQNQTARIGLKLEKSKLMPDIFVGYSSMTMQGIGSDEVFYTRSSRFQSVQVGLGVPLFFGAQKSKINVARTVVSMASNNYDLGYSSLKSQYFQAFSVYQAALKTLGYYESVGLKNAKEISNSAWTQYRAGQINYLEYVLLLNQSVTIESDYYNALRSYNEAVIQINFLTQTK